MWDDNYKCKCLCRAVSWCVSQTVCDTFRLLPWETMGSMLAYLNNMLADVCVKVKMKPGKIIHFCRSQVWSSDDEMMFDYQPILYWWMIMMMACELEFAPLGWKFNFCIIKCPQPTITWWSCCSSSLCTSRSTTFPLVWTLGWRRESETTQRAVKWRKRKEHVLISFFHSWCEGVRKN